MSIWLDFSKANYTAVISDLHLCEEEPIHPRFPLWKKYKTRQFFFDDEFRNFLDYLHESAIGESIELVLNGDIFDFDSVTSIPADPPFYVSRLERLRGLHPQEEKSEFKIEKILSDHRDWVNALRTFVGRGHRVIFVIGNHDVELYFPRVQAKILEMLSLDPARTGHVRFCEWFYISNGDTLIEHGHQYDPYCVSQDPVNPYVLNYNRLQVRVPFGNLATRYLINGMGFFNPHLDSNYIMTPKQYLVFFWRYMFRAQPLLMITWLWGSTITLLESFKDRLRPTISDPLKLEDRIEQIAIKANATPRVVRELRELAAAPASSNPFLLMRELWLDRASIVLMVILVMYLFFLQIDAIVDISILWVLVPVLLFIPFLIFYSRSIRSAVSEYKEPQERVLSLSALITKASRVVYGHTHIVRHEIIGAVEHLNSGTWSPAFLDVECKKPIGQKTFVFIKPDGVGGREAGVYQIKDGSVHEVFAPTGGKANRQKMDAFRKAE